MVSEGRHFLLTQHARSSRMRKRSSRPAALLRTYRPENAGSVYCCERATGRQFSCSQYSFSRLSPVPVSGVVVEMMFSCYWVIALSVYQGAYIAFPASERGQFLAFTFLSGVHIPSYCSLIT